MARLATQRDFTFRRRAVLLLAAAKVVPQQPPSLLASWTVSGAASTGIAGTPSRVPFPTATIDDRPPDPARSSTFRSPVPTRGSTYRKPPRVDFQALPAGATAPSTRWLAASYTQSA